MREISIPDSRLAYALIVDFDEARLPRGDDSSLKQRRDEFLELASACAEKLRAVVEAVIFMASRRDSAANATRLFKDLNSSFAIQMVG